MDATFPKSERLCSKIRIEELFANGESRRSGGFTVKFLRTHVGAGFTCPEPEGGQTPPLPNVRMLSKVETPKILISVPKRFQKHAVDRNRTKRLIREVYRKHKHLLARVCNPCQNIDTDEDVHASVHVSASSTSTFPEPVEGNGKIHALAIIYASSKIPEYIFVEEHLSKLLEKIR